MLDDMHKMLLHLPVKVFMYEFHQVANMLDVDLDTFKKTMVYYQGRTRRRKDRHDLVAKNISRPDVAPVWRIDEPELIRWLKCKGIKFYAPRRVNSTVT